MLFDVASFLLRIAFLAFNVIFCSGEHLGQHECRVLGEELIEVTFLKSIL